MKISLPNAVTTRFGRQVLVMQKNSPKVLFGTGLVLMGATVVSSSRATLRLGDVLDEIRDDREAVAEAAEKQPEKYDEKQIAKVNFYVTIKGILSISKLYLPSAILGVAAVACLTSSHNQLTRRNAGLSAALAATDRALKNYRERVVAEYGEEKDREFMFGSEDDTKVVTDGKTTKTKKVKRAGDGLSPYARIWGRDTSSEWDPQVEYNVAKLKSVMNYATLRLNTRGHVFLNEIYDELGLSRTPAGSQVGWLAKKYGGQDGYIDFGVFDENDPSKFLDFVTGREDHILLDFNVDGEIWRDI